MMDLYSFSTNNARRVNIVLAESGLKFHAHTINIYKGEQHAAKYLKINPLGAVPAIIDRDTAGGAPLLLTQSGAICLYIADKVGKFLPRNKRKRAVALQWFTHAITDVSGYNWASVHVTRVPKVVKANTDFFEVLLFKQLAYCNDRLGKEEYLAGDLSLADFALYPPVLLRAPLIEAYGGLEHLSRWAATMAKRPGVKRGIELYPSRFDTNTKH